MDKTDGKADNKISASVWNLVAKSAGIAEIKNYITTENAEKILLDNFDTLLKKGNESIKSKM